MGCCNTVVARRSHVHVISITSVRPSDPMSHVVGVPWNSSARSGGGFASGKGLVENSRPRVRSTPSHGKSVRDLCSVHRHSHGNVFLSQEYFNVRPLFATVNHPSFTFVVITSPQGGSLGCGTANASATGTSSKGAAVGNRGASCASGKVQAALQSLEICAPSRKGSPMVTCSHQSIVFPVAFVGFTTVFSCIALFSMVNVRQIFKAASGNLTDNVICSEDWSVMVQGKTPASPCVGRHSCLSFMSLPCCTSMVCGGPKRSMHRLCPTIPASKAASDVPPNFLLITHPRFNPAVPSYGILEGSFGSQCGCHNGLRALSSWSSEIAAI
eukprot:m.90019 g.90019  ORF g.90019 m.90019 type:complete len:327 (+) comp16452_c0_seq6:364-1344(+)